MHERPFDVNPRSEQLFHHFPALVWYRSSNTCSTLGDRMSAPPLSERQQEILVFIEKTVGERGYPPSVREIGEAVGLASPSTVHSHLHTLQKLGYLRRDATKPRAMEVTADTASGTTAERRPTRHVPLVGDVAAGVGVLAQEQVEELVPLPADFTGDGELFMLRVRGDSMIDAGILDGDFIVARVEPKVVNGDVVVAGIPGDEATVKTYFRKDRRVVLEPANSTMEPMTFEPSEVQVYGKVVTILRKL
jgi:repressor LexA